MDSTIEAIEAVEPEDSVIQPPPEPPPEAVAETEARPADPRLVAIPDSHGHAKGEHKPFAEERPIPYTARMLFLWFFHACRRGSPRFMMVADHMNYLTFEDPAAVNLVRRALKLAQAGDLYGAAETAGVEVGHAQAVSEGLRRGMRYSIGAEVDNDPRSRPDAQNIVDAMRPDGMVRSVHFLPITHPIHGENWMWAFDNPEFKDLYEVVGTEAVWEIYMATLLDAVEKLPGNIVGHFYVPAVFGHWPDDAVLEGYEDKLVDACVEKGMAIELNSRYLYKHYRGDETQIEKFKAVHLRLMRKAVEKGVLIAVGSDAHSPKDQGRGFEAVLSLLDEAEINEIAFPIGGRLARVALRATEELMKQHMPPEPEPLPPAPEPVAAPVPEPVAKGAAKPRKPRPSRAKVPAVAAEAVTDEPTVRDEPAASDAPAEPVPETAHEAVRVAAKPAKKAASKKTPSPPVELPPIIDAIVETAKSIVKKILPDPAPVVAPAKAAPVKAAPKKPEPKKTAPIAAPKPAPKPTSKSVASKPPAKAKVAAPVKKAAPAKKAAASKKSPPAKKAAPAKKAVAKKKSAPIKPAAKKATAKKKPIAKKPVAKKAAPAKKSVPAKKAGPKKKAVAKKPTAKKTSGKSAKRPAPKKAPVKKSAKRARR